MRYFLLALSLFTSLAWGSTYYARPASGGSYGNGSGTSYANAFSGDTAIWASGITSGDTLYVCGTWREALTIQKPGITMRLDCSGDPAILDGTNDYDHTGWTLTSGEYCRALSLTNGTSHGGIGTAVIKNGTHLSFGQIGSLTSGQWACSNTTGFPAGVCNSTSTTVCVKDQPVAGDTFQIPIRERLIGINPNNSAAFDGTNIVIYGGGGSLLKNSAQSGISATSDGHVRNYGSFMAYNITCDWMGEQCIHVYGTTGVSWTEVHIFDTTCTNGGGECIYVKDYITTSVEIARTTCTGPNYGWQATYVFGSFAGDCVDLTNQTGTYEFTSSVYGTKCTDSNGSGVNFGGGLSNIYNNTIVNCDQLGDAASTSSGLKIDPQRSGLVKVYGNYVYASGGRDNVSIRGTSVTSPTIKLTGNILVNGDSNSGICILKDSSYFANITISNNTMSGCAKGFNATTNASNPTASNLSNNVFFNTPIAWYVQRDTITGLTAANNNVYGAGATPYCTGLSTSCSASPQAQFTGTTTNDPLFRGGSQAVNVYDFTPLASSNLIGAGVCTSPALVDFYNRRFNCPSDQGAIASRVSSATIKTTTAKRNSAFPDNIPYAPDNTPASP